MINEDSYRPRIKKFKTCDLNAEGGSLEENCISDSFDVKNQDYVREAGPYYIGPLVKKYVRTPTTQCMVRKKGTDDYHLMKILVLNDGNTKDKFYYQRRSVFYTEYSILSLLKGQPGVIQLHDFFKDNIYMENEDDSAPKRCVKRMCMVLECLIPHGSHNQELIPLTYYIKEKKKLTEVEALHIFSNILTVVEALHKKNIVHKDLKLCNIILNRKTLQVKLVNFYYAKLLNSDMEIPHYRRGSPSYFPPDIISGKLIAPKPCDMWSTGVILYGMLHGHLPFTGSLNSNAGLTATPTLAELYSQIRNMDYSISNNISISDGTKKLITSLLCKDPYSRLKASEALDMAHTLLAVQSSSQNPSIFGDFKNSDQIVPECPDFENKDGESSSENCNNNCWLIVSSNVENSNSKSRKISLSEIDFASQEPKCKIPKLDQDQSLNGEKDVLSKCCHVKTTHPPRRDSSTRNNKIKFAMLRLGATSVNKITALSFNYSNRNCPS